ncbi:PREDICTED: uncharacterized protein LOC109337195 [Lupinus angustifolius]|uniref:uncharacterized protein LOC109337195 n=1 Tax=Lupinus angustifolius TaxID=3871 RepID=UPI00092ED290|nr:PREDICTED: uncharacterized protein LOC109337195 [Lupinus angustifolius]
MATIIKLSLFLFLFAMLSNSKVLSSTTEPTISASPSVLPYVTSPDISSFFPTPSTNKPMSSSAPSEAQAPAPSSGEFEGKKSSNSAKLDCVAAIVVILLSSLLMSNVIVV